MLKSSFHILALNMAVKLNSFDTIQRLSDKIEKSKYYDFLDIHSLKLSFFALATPHITLVTFTQ